MMSPTMAITIAELVRNGTMSAQIAGTLWAAVDEQRSFLTVAIPRFAGKSTLSNAVLALRRPDQRGGGRCDRGEVPCGAGWLGR